MRNTSDTDEVFCLEGTVPDGVLHLPKLIKLRVAKNAGLSGDIITDEMAETEGRVQAAPLALNHQHTGIRLCRATVRARATGGGAGLSLGCLAPSKAPGCPGQGHIPGGYTSRPEFESDL